MVRSDAKVVGEVSWGWGNWGWGRRRRFPLHALPKKVASGLCCPASNQRRQSFKPSTEASQRESSTRQRQTFHLAPQIFRLNWRPTRQSGTSLAPLEDASKKEAVFVALTFVFSQGTSPSDGDNTNTHRNRSPSLPKQQQQRSSPPEF